LILTSGNYAFAAATVAVASTVSAFLVLRRLARLNLVGVLKAPE
jgi:putative ABC transport system permease protein